MKQFKGVLLDLDNTLYDFETAHRPAFTKLIDHYSAVLRIEPRKFLNVYEQSQLEINRELDTTASSHNRLLYFQRACEHLNINPINYAYESYEMYWNEYIRHMVFDDGVEEFFAAAKGKKMVIVTDLTADVQYKKLVALKLGDRIDFVVTSEETGVEKPDPLIFHTALSKAGLKASQVCMIGDNYDKDIIGAIDLNIQAYWINRDGAKKKPHPLVTECKSFRELINL